MKPKSFMLIAGEASGDTLAAELVRALRPALAAAESAYTAEAQPARTGLEPRFFGAGGPRLRDAGVELAFDLTEHSVIGLSDVLQNYLKFRRLFNQLRRLAIEREPDAIICVDFSGFNRRFAHAIRRYARSRQDWFHDWRPRIVQYVSPQVWASREDRAYQIARDYDLLLSIFPFEKEWYAKRVPQLHVEFVGHPMLDRFRQPTVGSRQPPELPASPTILLLPGSRPEELSRHLPVMLDAWKLIRSRQPGVCAKVILPHASLVQQAKSLGLAAAIEVQAGGLGEALARAEVAIASTGTVTMECAWFGVPTVALYKTSWSNYEIAKRLVKVKWLAMPNLLANEEVFPEFIQGAATPERLAGAALELLRDDDRRRRVKARLAQIVTTLGGPGANRRAAAALVRLLEWPK